MGTARAEPAVLVPRICRAAPDPLSKAIGEHIGALCREKNLTAEELAYQSEAGSNGYLSDIEAGLASPSLATLQKIATHLEVDILDLVTFPDESTRPQLRNARK